jgi:type II restriction/modification system DNA methylase subunit YeeA
MTPLQFVDKWRPVTLTERAAAQSHFNDLCHLFDHPTPLDDDPVGDHFTFEKGVKKSGGGDGFADVWKRDYFAWEYKKRRRNLDEALGQLARYALALESPPLHVVCDTDRFRIVTAYTNSVPRSYDLSLEDILDPKKRGWLEAAFYSPKSLKPGASRSDLTRQAADKFSTLAERLQKKGYPSEDVAHFVNRLVFLFFAEDVRLLPEGYFRRVIAEISTRPKDAKSVLTGLFAALLKGSRFGLDVLPWVNGGLFDERESLDLDEHEIGLLKAAGSQNWGHIDPSIFGTVFERFLDPDKRAQIGAHYTDASTIIRLISPVVMAPLNLEWSKARNDIETLVSKARIKGAKAKEWRLAEERRSVFLERLRTLSILDPACGSGNFLYLALQSVKNLEHAANQECESFGLPPRLPVVGPEILRGLEINPLAAELARTTIWIGDIQWAIQNGIYSRPEPILRRLDAIECRDALLNSDGSEASWPAAEFIVGNPPFLGDKRMLASLGEPYTSALRAAYASQLPGRSDLVCYWFAKAKKQIVLGAAQRVGLVATNSIRQDSNRHVLKDISRTLRIFEVWDNEAWAVDGAAVRVSLVCFDGRDGDVSVRLNGEVVTVIHPDLTASTGENGLDLSSVNRLDENAAIAYQGVKRVGKFELRGDLASALTRT